MITGDAGDYDTVSSMMDKISAAFPSIDLLINKQARAFTRMPLGASSFARAFVKALTPPLDAL